MALVGGGLEELVGGVRVLRRADELVDGGAVLSTFAGKAVYDLVDRKIGDVDSYPIAVHSLGGDDGGAAPGERIEDYVAFVAAGGDDAFEKREGFLGGVAATLGSKVVYWTDVRDNVLYSHTGEILDVLLEPRHAPFLLGPMKSTRCV